MTSKCWLTFCCGLLLAASVCGAQPGQALPPPPGARADASPSDMPAAPMPTKSPLQAPIQAPPVKAPQVVTCTVMVPQVSYKTVTVPDVVCRPEVRQQNVSVCRLVPETQMVTCNQTVCVPERRTATQQYTICRM